MSDLSKPQKIWLELFERFLMRGVGNLHDLATLNSISHALLRTVPAVEAQSFLPTLSTICAVCHQQGQPDGPRCDEHQLLDSTTVIYMGDDGTGVALCGDCRKRVEELTAAAEAQNPDDPEDTDAFNAPLRAVN